MKSPRNSARGTRGARGARGARDTRDTRGARGTRDTRDTRDTRGTRGTRGTRDTRGTRGAPGSRRPAIDTALASLRAFAARSTPAALAACSTLATLAAHSTLAAVGMLALAAHPLAARQAAPEDGGALRIDGGILSIDAVVQAETFARAGPPDGQYHALVSRAGGAAPRALFVTDASDAGVAAALRAIGADDGGGVPMRAWSLRGVPLAPWSSARVHGSPVTITIDWEGAERPLLLEELVEADEAGRDGPAGQDAGDAAIEMRFGGNEEHDEHWDSGCIVCLFSCPGGVISNGARTIRDHVRGATRFRPGARLPPDGTPVTITLQLSPG